MATKAIKKTVILNDTSHELHHGCKMVMSNIRSLLSKRGVRIIDANPVHVNWEDNRRLQENIKKSDFVVINGEGTLHHNQKTGLYLLKAASFCRKCGIPVALINATYYENNQEFGVYMKNFDLIFVRESITLQGLRKSGIQSEVVPDMTFYNSLGLAPKIPNNRVGFTDSVFLELSEKLLDYSKKSEDFIFLPILISVRIESPCQVKSILRKIKFEALKAVNIRGKSLIKKKISHVYERMAYYIESSEEYMQAINALKLLVTGRFHSLCFALKTQTPFLTFMLDSYKVEGLLNDIGLGRERIITIEDLDDGRIKRYGDFTEDEFKKITAYTDTAGARIEAMFDKIISLAGR
ncbi:MAG: polysaccharide pyruvyl transferase family protein [Candidatus Omnitrophota bacterium]